MPELLQRVERLERQNARLRGLLVVTCVAVASFAAVGQDVLPLPLRTGEIVIAGPDAATKAVLGLTEGAPVLRFYDEQGHARIVMSVTPDGPRLVVTDEDGRPRDIFSHDAGIVPLTRR